MNLPRWGVFFILVTAFVFRWPLISGSLWLDEAAQALESARPLSEQLSLTADFQPPLTHLWLHFWMQISHAEWWMRTGVALLPGLGSVYLTYLLGRTWFSKQVGLWAALLLATSSLHVFYSQELRSYSLQTFWALLSWFIWWQWQNQNSIKQKMFLIGSYCLVSLAGLYTAYLYPFILITQAGVSLWYSRNNWSGFLKTWLPISIFIILGVSFWIPSFLAQLAAGQELRSSLPGWENIVSFSPVKSLTQVGIKFLFGVVDVELNTWYIGWTLFISVILGYLSWGAIKSIFHFSAKKNQTQWLPLIWFGGTLATAWIVSLWVPVIQPKRVLYLLPAFYLWVGYLISRSQSSRTRVFSLILAASMLFINIWGCWSYWTQPVLQRENWRDLIQVLIEQTGENRAVAVFAFDEPFAPWRWYAPQSIDALSSGQLYIDSTYPITDALKNVQNYRIVYVFDYLRDLTDPQHRINTTLAEWGWREKNQIVFPQIGIVRVYLQPDQVLSLRIAKPPTSNVE